jgi:hypothetical protein
MLNLARGFRLNACKVLLMLVYSSHLGFVDHTRERELKGFRGRTLETENLIAYIL